MKKYLTSKMSLLLALMLVAAMTIGCGKKAEETAEQTTTKTENQTAVTAVETEATETADKEDTDAKAAAEDNDTEAIVTEAGGTEASEVVTEAGDTEATEAVVGEAADTEAVITTDMTDNTEAAAVEGVTEAAEVVEYEKVGEGNTVFYFISTDADGKSQYFEVSTDETTVGAALLDLKMIEGEDSSYGLYVKTVNGVTADYEKDGTYWAFYIDGVYASTGVDSTDITAGSTYSFVVEK